MSDTEHIKRSMNLKEVREWTNFVFTVLILPIGYLLAHSLSMDIKADVAKDYVTKASYLEDRQRLENERSADRQTLGLIQGKIESLQMSQIHQADTLALIKEQMSTKR